MKLNFKFSNLLGTVYQGGNVQFTPDGNTLISPVGNKISLFDLKNQRSETLPIETSVNIVAVSVNPSGTHALIVSQAGEAVYVSLIAKTILHRHRFGRSVKDIRFAPDGRRFAVCRDGDVQIMRCPGLFAHQYNPFVLEETYKVATDANTCLDWSDDCRLVAVGSIDMQIRVIAGKKRVKNLFIKSLGGHKAPIVACFFEADSFNLLTMDRKMFMNRWECSIDSRSLVTGYREERDKSASNKDHVLAYTKAANHHFATSVSGLTELTAAAYHKKNRLLLTGFNNGPFLLHEMPHFNLIHNLRSGAVSVRSVAINPYGDWLAIACKNASSRILMVWEWQSETLVLRRDGETGGASGRAVFSPDGGAVAGTGHDGRVRIWPDNVSLGSIGSPVTAMVWTRTALLAASLDGCVRAFDPVRYVQLRTLVTPQPAQLTCLTADCAGRIVVAGARDVFHLFVWSLQNARLLEVLSGHTAPVSGVCFNPIHPILASVSWDRTLRIWDVFEGKANTQPINLTDEGLDVVFSPDGQFVATVSIDCRVSWFDWRQGLEIGSIEARFDLDPGRADTDMISKNKSAVSKSLTSLDYSADGQFIICAGQSKYLCLYHTGQQVLVKKFQITHNYSLDSVADDINGRKMRELPLIDASDSENDESAQLGLDAHSRPQIRVSLVRFSPTGRSFAACTTEGLLIYSLDDTIIFDPFQLDVDITPKRIKSEIENKEWTMALRMALRLNDRRYLVETIEKTPLSQVAIVCRFLPMAFVERLLAALAVDSAIFEQTSNLHFYLLWLKYLLFYHGAQLKIRLSQNLPALTAVEDILSRKRHLLSRICESNKYCMNYILAVKRLNKIALKTEEAFDRM